MTLLTIVQDACDVIGIPRPSAVVGGGDQSARTLLALANREGRELAKRYPWARLQEEYAFSAPGGDDDSFDLPDGFDRFIDETFWNTTRQRPVFGPITQAEWQQLNATSSPAILEVWMLRQNQIRVKPAPTAGDNYSILYISAYWCGPSPNLGTQTQYQLDDDVALLSEELITLGLIWRFLQSRGLEYGEARATYEAAVARDMARDGGRMRMQTGAPRLWRPGPAVPEGSWNL